MKRWTQMSRTMEQAPIRNHLLIKKKSFQLKIRMQMALSRSQKIKRKRIQMRQWMKIRKIVMMAKRRLLMFQSLKLMLVIKSSLKQTKMTRTNPSQTKKKREKVLSNLSKRMLNRSKNKWKKMNLFRCAMIHSRCTS